MTGGMLHAPDEVPHVSEADSAGAEIAHEVLALRI